MEVVPSAQLLTTDLGLDVEGLNWSPFHAELGHPYPAYRAVEETSTATCAGSGEAVTCSRLASACDVSHCELVHDQARHPESENGLAQDSDRGREYRLRRSASVETSFGLGSAARD